MVSMYYVVDWCIFQAPTLASLIDSKLTQAIFYAKKAYEILNPLETKEPESSEVAQNFDFIFETAALQHPSYRGQAIPEDHLADSELLRMSRETLIE